MDEALTRAKAHFESGNSHYAAGRFEEAIKEFEAGYALVPRPSFLLNLGQAHRKLGHLPRAKEAFLAYLRGLPEDSPLRDQALKVLAEIEVQLRADGAAGGYGQPPPPPPAIAAPAASALAARAPAPAGVAVASAPGSTRRWTAVGLGGTAVVLGVAGGTLQLLAKRASDDLSERDRNHQAYDPDLHAQGVRNQRTAVVLIATAGAAALAGLLVYPWSGGGAEKTVGDLSIAPLMIKTGSGAVVGARF